jgi:excisionase family DNA binding protein
VSGGTARHRVGRSARRRRLSGMSEITLTEHRPWFTTDTLAAYLQVSDRMIRKWVAEGRLRSYKLDGCRRFDPGDVERFIQGMRDERPVAA